MDRRERCVEANRSCQTESTTWKRRRMKSTHYTASNMHQEREIPQSILAITTVHPTLFTLFFSLLTHLTRSLPTTSSSSIANRLAGETSEHVRRRPLRVIREKYHLIWYAKKQRSIRMTEYRAQSKELSISQSTTNVKPQSTAAARNELAQSRAAG